jgi:probable HAF family extracellular repeat protein
LRAGESTLPFFTGPNGMGRTYLGGYGSTAIAINDTGQVAGYYFNTLFNQNSVFITGPHGVGLTDLHTLSGIDSEAVGINAAGQVVGTTNKLVGPQDKYGSGNAFITGPNGVGMTDLGTLGGNFSSATGINDAGQVVGSAETSVYTGNSYGQRFIHAFITGPNGVGMRDLGTLSGGDSLASDINAAGQVVGTSNTDSPYNEHAFITGPNGQGMTDLGTLGGINSSATGINDAGQVVGDYSYYDSSSHMLQYRAFVTGPNGVGMTDLNSLVSLPAGVVLSEATAINNAGQVIAISVVPEPQSYALMLVGLFLTGVMVRRKQKG